MMHRQLTHDEQRAAEAAFRGIPFNPKWSSAARAVYDGILKALPAGHAGRVLNSDASGEAILDSSSVMPPAPGTTHSRKEDQPSPDLPVEADSKSAEGPITSRQEAVEQGILIDVSPMASELGFTIPIGISKPLWESGITVAGHFNDLDVERRIRDVLMALRLSLGGSRDLPSVMQFGALLAFPPESVPRLCSMIAVAHKDAEAPFALTLLHPSEVHQIYPFLN